MAYVLPVFASQKSKKDKKKKQPVIHTAYLLDGTGSTITYSYEIQDNLIVISNIWPGICNGSIFEKKLKADEREDHYRELSEKRKTGIYDLVPFPTSSESIVYFETESECLVNMVIRPTQTPSVIELFKLKTTGAPLDDRSTFMGLYSLVKACTKEIEKQKTTPSEN